MYALCVSGAVNTQGFVWKFFLCAIYKFSFIHSFIHFHVFAELQVRSLTEDRNPKTYRCLNFTRFLFCRLLEEANLLLLSFRKRCSLMFMKSRGQSLSLHSSAVEF